MASLNFNFNLFNDWFKQPTTLFFLIDRLNPLKLQTQNPNKFAAISLNPFSKKTKKPAREPGYYKKLADQFFWEVENRPDYRHTPEVEKILKEDRVYERMENPTPEEIEENKRRWEEFRSDPVVEFLMHAEEIADKINELELEANSTPYRKEDKKAWQAVPHVIGLDGRPMPRKAIKSRKEAEDKFWDFAKQFFFGLWGFRQRPYPSGRPIDVAQAIGYKKLEERYYDFIMKSGGWWYKDRLGRSRGPSELIQLKTAWGAGIIDRHTFIWGEDMDEWVPIGMVYGLERAIATWEVRFCAAATAFLHKLQKGIPPWVPLKGHENKTLKQLQEEAYESKRRDLAVLEANNGVWPGVSIPSPCLFLWASGAELTPLMSEDHMPNKYIPKDVRRQLQKVIPGLRPWEVLSVEQAMDQITYGGEWYREPLGTFTTGPPYIEDWNEDVMRLLNTYHDLSIPVYNQLTEAIPGFSTVVEKVQADAAEREAKRMEKRNAMKKAEEEQTILDGIRSSHDADSD